MPLDAPLERFPFVPAQRELSRKFREHHPAWNADNATKGGSPYDRARVEHVRRVKVASHMQDSPLKDVTRGDSTELSATPLSWLLVTPGSPKFDSFPRHLFILYLSLLLGVPIPEPPGRPFPPDPRCSCPAGTQIDAAGHHLLTCKAWAAPTFKRGHDDVVRSLVDAARSFGVPCSSQPKDVPRHPRSQKQGDVIFHAALSTGKTAVADVTVCHPVLGSPQDGSEASVGTWQSGAMQARFSAKWGKHNAAYDRRGFLFVPLVASTFGVLHADFVRFLWAITHVYRDPSLAVGEVREAGAATPMRHLLFLKLHARMSVAAARAAAMRLDGLAHAPCMLPPDSRFVPDDPDFAWSASLSPLELGPVSSDDLSE